MRLDVDGLCKRYGKKIALNDVNLHLTPGVYGLLGPNGAGKSTLMNIIVGNLKPDFGTIHYNGTDVRDAGRAYRSILGFMPQQQGLYDQFTGYQFLTYIADLKGLSKGKAKQEIEYLLTLLNLKEQRNKRLGAYSGGMKQRILLAQAVLNNPKILILDEPTAGLDPKERIRVKNMISEIAIDKIVILATHVVSDIEQIGKEVILIKKGKILGQEKPRYFLEELNEKVFDVIIPPQLLPEIEKKYLVSSVSYYVEHLMVHIVSAEVPLQYDFQKSKPTLEDVYLYRFADEVK